jgi:hypothetical protein
MDMELPKLTYSRTLSDWPAFACANTEKEEPMRIEERKDIAEPIAIHVKMLAPALPPSIFVLLNTDKDDPSLAAARTLILDPKSRYPSTDTASANLPIDLTLILEPIDTFSKIDIFRPLATCPWLSVPQPSDMEEPKRINDLTLKDEEIDLKFKALMELPQRI